MEIEILGAESLGVRGLSCVVTVDDHRLVIDPGLALGYQRQGLLPHPAQVAIGERVRKRIVAALRLAESIGTLILDHHLLRCEEGLAWLDRLAAATGHRVICAADFMGQPRCLLEAQREQLYEEMPVPEG